MAPIYFKIWHFTAITPPLAKARPVIGILTGNLLINAELKLRLFTQLYTSQQ